MIIKSSENGSELEFSEKESLLRRAGQEYFLVSLRNNNLSASTKVYISDPYDAHLTLFFMELAKDWRGFDGEKVWNSLEGEFGLICMADRLGHFAIEATIRDAFDTWRVKNTIFVEAGQLAKIADDVKKFFDSSS